MNKCTKILPDGAKCNCERITVSYDGNTVKARCTNCGKTVAGSTPEQVRARWDIENPRPLKEQTAPKKSNRLTVLDRYKKQEVELAWLKSKGVKVHAAKKLGVSTASINKLLKHYQIK